MEVRYGRIAASPSRYVLGCAGLEDTYLRYIHRESWNVQRATSSRIHGCPYKRYPHLLSLTALSCRGSLVTTSEGRPAIGILGGCVPQPCLHSCRLRSLPHGWTPGDATMSALRLELQWMNARLREVDRYVPKYLADPARVPVMPGGCTQLPQLARDGTRRCTGGRTAPLPGHVTLARNPLNPNVRVIVCAPASWRFSQPITWQQAGQSYHASASSPGQPKAFQNRRVEKQTCQILTTAASHNKPLLASLEGTTTEHDPFLPASSCSHCGACISHLALTFYVVCLSLLRLIPCLFCPGT